MHSPVPRSIGFAWIDIPSATGDAKTNYCAEVTEAECTMLGARDAPEFKLKLSFPGGKVGLLTFCIPGFFEGLLIERKGS